MNVKILLFPLVLVVIIWLAIWHIAPNYTLMNQQRDLLDKNNQKLAEVQEKNIKANKLVVDFDNAVEDRKIIFKYLPDQKNEAEIIGTIDTIAFLEGISLYNFSIVDVIKNTVSDFSGMIPGTSYLPTESISPPAMLDINGMPVVPQAPETIYPTVDETNVKLEFVTNYDKLKIFLTKLSNLKRFNKVNSLQIGKASATGENVDPNFLQISLGLNFNYLLIKSSRDILSEATFQTKDFDTEAISGLKNKLNTDITPIDIGQKGKSNPFLPE